MPAITENCLSGLGRRFQNSTRSSNAAMPSYWPRSTSVGASISAGSTTGSFEHMSMYVPLGIESSSARIASAKASTTRFSAQSGWSRSKIE